MVSVVLRGLRIGAEDRRSLILVGLLVMDLPLRGARVHHHLHGSRESASAGLRLDRELGDHAATLMVLLRVMTSSPVADGWREASFRA